MPIDLLNFVRKWNASTLTERSAAPQHFRDLCEVLDVPHPTEADEIGASYTYEKHVTKAGTGEPASPTSGSAAGSPGSTNPRAATSRRPTNS